MTHRPAASTAAGGAAAVDGLRLATFPADHPYLDAVRPAGVRAVWPPAGGSPWAPHPWWEPAALARAAAGLDVAHVHFGFDHLRPEELRDWTVEVSRLRLPLVVTVHDLRNPHHDRPERHDAHLACLLAAADAVLTLTPGAAAAIRRRWGRRATVVPHPCLGCADPATPPPLRPVGAGRPTVGVHLKSLRRNVCEPGRIVAAVATGAARAGGELVVDVHRDAAAAPELAEVYRLAAAGALRLRVHDRFTDEELTDYLLALDVSVLPHRFGTHSGWLELCRDLGTRVVAPDCGFYAEQWPAVALYGNSEERGLDPGGLAAAVTRALAAPRLTPADPGRRRAERQEIRRMHAATYAAVTA